MKSKEKVLNFIYKNYVKEKDKWISGLKNNYFEWEDTLQEYLNFLQNKKNKKEVLEYEQIKTNQIK